MTIFLMALATFRLSTLLSDEAGPYNILGLMRAKALHLNYELHEGLTCMYCNSIWIGALFTLLYIVNPTIALYVAMPFALSCPIVLLEEYVRKGEA